MWYSYTAKLHKRFFSKKSVLFTGIMSLFFFVSTIVAFAFYPDNFVILSRGFKYIYLAAAVLSLYSAICFLTLYFLSSSEFETYVDKPFFYAKTRSLCMTALGLFTLLLFIPPFFFGTVPYNFLIVGTIAGSVFFLYGLFEYRFYHRLLLNVSSNMILSDGILLYAASTFILFFLCAAILVWLFVTQNMSYLLLSFVSPSVFYILTLGFRVMFAIQYLAELDTIDEIGFDVSYSPHLRSLICPHCGKELSHKDHFCKHCGTRIY